MYGPDDHRFPVVAVLGRDGLLDGAALFVDLEIDRIIAVIRSRNRQRSNVNFNFSAFIVVADRDVAFSVGKRYIFVAEEIIVGMYAFSTDIRIGIVIIYDKRITGLKGKRLGKSALISG